MCQQANLPNLADVRKHLPASVMAWVDAVLAGESNASFCERMGIKSRGLDYHRRAVSEWAGLGWPDGGWGSVREAILQMRIVELEAAAQRRGD